MLPNSWLAFVCTTVLCIIWLRIVNLIAHKGLISTRLSRKIIHIGTGPIFVLCWLLFPSQPEARFLAAVIPLLITVQFILIGLGVIKDQPSIDAMSRSGDPREILKGPMYYGIMFVLITVFFWKSPVGIIALMMLCGGDGMADLVGSKYGIKNLPWSKSKTTVGTATVFLSGFLFSIGILLIYSAIDSNPTISLRFFPVLLIALVAALVESLPLNDLDNVTVPVASILTGLILYG
jgi:phytol kinase